MPTPGTATNGSSGFFTDAKEIAEYLIDCGASWEADASEPKISCVAGVSYLYHKGQLMQIKTPIPDDAKAPDAMVFFTLDGIIDYIIENTEKLVPEDPEKKLILQVVNHRSVVLWSHPSEHHKSRAVIAKCDAHAPEITFERYLSTDAFNTMLLSVFLETEARAELFRVVKSLTKEQDLNVSDDGVSQVLTVKQGVSLASNTQFQNPVPLKPMRTFAEVDQPESNFTLRVNENAQAALFEADGGAWKNVAVALIKEYLKINLSTCNVAVIA